MAAVIDNKNPGPLLTSRIAGSLDVIPNEWIAKIGFVQNDQEVPLTGLPDTVDGSLVASKVVQVRTDERKKTSAFLNAAPTGGWNLVSQERLPNGQIATRTRSFVPEGTGLVLSDQTLSAEQKNLGVSQLDQSVLTASLPGPGIIASRFDDLATLVRTTKTRKLISQIVEGEVVLLGTRTITTKEGETATVATEVKAVDTLPGTAVISSRIDPDGALVTITKTKKLASTIVEGETVFGTIWKKTYRDGETGLVAVEVVEVRVIPTPTVRTARIENDGLIVNVTKIRKSSTTIVTSESIVGTVWKKVFKEGDDALVATEVTEIATLPGPSVTSSRIDTDGMVVTVLKTRKASTSIVPSETISGTTWKKVYGDGMDLLVATEIIETRTLPGPAVVSSRAEPDGFFTTITKTRKVATSIVNSETLTGGVWKKVYKDGEDGLVATEVIESRNIPGGTIPSAAIDSDQQLVSTTKILKDKNAIIPGSTLSGTTITTTEQKDVSDLISQEVKSVRTFLNKNLKGLSVENPWPPRFQSSVQITQLSDVVAGTVALPTLGGTELERSEQQLDRLLKRISVRKFTGTLPISFTDKEVTTEYGGLLLNIENKLDTAGNSSVDILPVDVTTPATIRAKRTRYGQFELREKATASTTFPALLGADFDEGLNLVLPYTQQVVAAGTLGGKTLGTVTTIRPLDAARSLSRQTRAPLDIATFYLALPGTTNIDFPPQLVSFASVVAAFAGSAGSYSQDGQYTIYNGGSEGISLNGNAEGSAGAAFDIQTVIKQVWGQNVTCINYLFFIGGPNPGVAAILARLNALAGGTVNPWPKFSPAAVQLTCLGTKLGGRCRADLQHRDSFIADYLGAVQRNGAARTAGSGFSFDSEVVVKTVTLPPTIHAALNLVGQSTLLQSFAATAHVGTNIQAVNIGVTGNASARVTPTTIPQTSGTQTIPTAGLFLHRLRLEPYKFGYIKVDAEVVNAVSWT